MGNHRIAATLAVLHQLPDLVKARRAELGVSLRTGEELSGVPFNIIARCERGDGGMTLDSAIKLLQWVGQGR